MLEPNSDPKICEPQQKSRFIRPGYVCPVFKSPVLVSLCPLQPPLCAIGWRTWKQLLQARKWLRMTGGRWCSKIFVKLRSFIEVHQDQCPILLKEELTQPAAKPGIKARRWSEEITSDLDTNSRLPVRNRDSVERKTNTSQGEQILPSEGSTFSLR